MNRKHLALNYNINAILDKSEPERKTFLDKMVNEKKETERLIKKLKPFAQQESLDKLSKQLQVLNTKIAQVKKSLPLVDHRKVLEQLGDVFPVTHRANGKTIKSLSLIVTEAGVKSCGFYLEEIFKDCPHNKTWQTASTGHIVDIDLYQQLALVKAFVLKYPALKNNFGFYNLRGSKAVSRVLKNNVDTSIIYCFLTGEVLNRSEYLEISDDDKYEKSKQRPAAGVVTLTTVKKSINSKASFCYRHCLAPNGWDSDKPEDHAIDMALVLGLIIE